jgi:serine protease AprX
MNGNKVSFKRRQWLLTSLSIVLIVSMLAMVLDLKPSNGGLMQSYIVQGQDVNRVVQLVERYGGTVTSRLDIIHGVGAMLSAPAAASLRSEAAITAITDNATVRATGNGNAPATDYADLVGADVVWDQGVTGSGVTVAVLDTGFSNHNGIKDNVIAWVDFVEGKNNQKDPSGHGTHIGGVIANTQIGEDGEANGIAPGAKLAGVRVLNEQGFGSYEKVIQGIQWVINNKDTYGIRVMNLSLVSPVQSPYWADPLNQAVMQAWAAGIVVVVAAGNGGPGPMTVGVPGDNPYVITVGAFSDNYTPYDWDDDFITPFSAAGPTLDGFVKPDVVAPGAHVVSTMIFSANLAKEYPERKIPPQYFTMAGTSQSAAVVSGVAALVLSANPDLTPDQVKHRISCTAFPWVDPTTTMALYSAWQQGSGRVNAPGAAFEEVDGTANVGMDISADLAGSQHYEGYSYYDETTGLFRMHGDFMDWGGGYWTWDGGYGSWSGGYGSWSGGYGSWSGGYGSWSGGYGSWSGGYGSWSGGYGSWSGGYGSWSGGYGSWSGGYGSWSGGYGSWSGGYGSWSGSEPWAGMVIAQPAFVEPFLAGVIPNTSTSITSIGFIDAP